MTPLEQAVSLLESMGGTPDAVAEFLKARGIKGLTDDAVNDPVCRFLRQELKSTDVCIEYGSVFVDTAGTWEPSAALPDAVDTFLEAFDAEVYPDLIDTIPPAMETHV